MLIDGRIVANHILAGLMTRVDELQEKYAIQPHLAVIRVGDNPATTSYINQKAKKAKEIGAVVSVYNFPNSVTEEKLKESIDFLQSKTDLHGLILQLPVPSHINYAHLLLNIHPDKDVDGFRPNSQFTVPIASAVMKLLEIPMIQETKNSGISLKEWLLSKKIVVMGKGKTGGQPIIDILKKNGAKVTVIDSSTVNRELLTKSADILISAVGKPRVVTAVMLKKDVILLGVGMGMDKEGKFFGDYDEEEIQAIASMYTPTPGGVGPVNVACLMENLVMAAENSVKKKF